MPIEKYHAWVYPGAPATNAPNEYRKWNIHVLRVEYYTLKEDGTLKLLVENSNDLSSTANAFSQKNVADIKAHSQEQLVTVSSGNIAAVRKMLSNPSDFMRKLSSFVVKWNLTGIDLNFEDFGSWTQKDFDSYLVFLKQFGTMLHRYNKKLAICTPAWTTAAPSGTPPFPMSYPKLATLPIDYITVMTYDYQYDHGVGMSITPLAWLDAWVKYLARIIPKNRLVIGLPSYGYTGTLDKWNDFKILTKQQTIAAGRYDPSKRNQDGEVKVVVGNKAWISNDTTSLRRKRSIVEKYGVTQVSVWHLGGNDWF